MATGSSTRGPPAVHAGWFPPAHLGGWAAGRRSAWQWVVRTGSGRRMVLIKRSVAWVARRPPYWRAAAAHAVPWAHATCGPAHTPSARAPRERRRGPSGVDKARSALGGAAASLSRARRWALVTDCGVSVSLPVRFPAPLCAFAGGAARVLFEPPMAQPRAWSVQCGVVSVSTKAKHVAVLRNRSVGFDRVRVML